MKLSRIGVGLAKNVYQLHGVDRHGKTVWKRRLRRGQWLQALLDKTDPGCRSFGLARYFMWGNFCALVTCVVDDRNAAAEDDQDNHGADYQVRKSSIQSGNQDSSKNYAGVRYHIVLRENPTRPHMDFAVSVLRDQGEANDIRYQRNYPNADHVQRFRLTSPNQAPHYLECNSHRQYDLKYAAYYRCPNFRVNGSSNSVQANGVYSCIREHIERISDQAS